MPRYKNIQQGMFDVMLVVRPVVLASCDMGICMYMFELSLVHGWHTAQNIRALIFVIHIYVRQRKISQCEPVKQGKLIGSVLPDHSSVGAAQSDCIVV